MRVPFKFTMVGAAVAALGIAFGVLAQPIGQNALSGNECWNAGQGPGGPSTGFVCAYMTRSSQGYYLSNNAVLTPNPLQLTNVQNMVVMSAQITPTASSFNMPLNPLDGAIVSFCNVTNGAFATTAVTITATAPQVFATGAVTTITTLAARTCVKLIYTVANTTWSQVQ
jgi:hypothetical protein